MVRFTLLNHISKCLCAGSNTTVELYEPVRVAIPKPAEPVVNAIPSAVAEPVAEPAVNAVPEPVAEAVAEPVAEPIAEPIPEPVAEPIPEPVVCESLTEEVNEELTEVTTDHIMSQPAIELANTIQYDICKIVVCYILTFLLLKSLLKEYLDNQHAHLDDHLERL